ncbi:MAG TPA: protein kinase [Ktedonobacteraceae bacterium]|nr:protein kinase [Ktedonobacteraceae bacterium]
MIDTEALIGAMLGTFTLQKVIGKGEIGVVFLAQQSHPHRQVAVKILSPASAQTPSQRSLFLERFRQEINSITSLQHRHILPVYDYGEYDGHAFLVMPYCNGGTLRDVIKYEGPLKLPKVASYLEQIAAALDYAHKQGIIHRDVKPANVLIASEGHLLLTDFGMIQIVAERQTTQRRLLRAGTPVGTPDYMAPEQIMGDAIDARTDIYALGILLYQMVTGKTPFQAETPMKTPMQMATQIVQISPPSPRLLRTDLPEAAEQVILQAIAKRPPDRYASVQDFVSAFLVAINRVPIPAAVGAINRAPTLSESSSSEMPAPAGAINRVPTLPLAMPRKRSLFDPVWQQAAAETPPSPVTRGNGQSKPTGLLSSIHNTSLQPVEEAPQPNDHTQVQAESTDPLPTTRTTPLPATRPRLGLKSGLLRPMDKKEPVQISPALPSVATPNVTRTLPLPDSEGVGTRIIAPVEFGTDTHPSTPFLERDHLEMRPSNDARASSSAQLGRTGVSGPYALPVSNPISPFPATNTTGALMVPGSEQGTLKLTGAVKVVQVPVAGQPGRYVTGFLPVLPQTQQPEEPLEVPKSEKGRVSIGTRFIASPGITTKVSKKLLMRSALALLVLLVLTGSSIFVYVHTRSPQPAKIGVHTENVTPDWQAIAAAEATATANANIIITDTLAQNIHNWPIATSGNQIYMFKDGAYHITNNGANQVAPALLPGEVVQGPMAYTLTMEEIKGDDSSINNSFGMMLRFSTQTGGKNVVTFYSFEALNTKHGEYQFSKYNNSKGPSANPWTTIWHHAFGSEFHQGHGPNSVNTFKVIAIGKSFTLIVNGKTITTIQDGSFASGEIGMLVNLKGTEVAFSNLMLTYS